MWRTIRVALAALVAAGLIAAPSFGVPATQAAPAAQDVPPPPGLGAPFLQSDLTGPEVFEPATCPRGVAGGENVGEGFKLSVRGRCLDQRSVADVAKEGRVPLIGDADVALDFKVVDGPERAAVTLYARVRASGYVAAYLSLASGQAELYSRESGVTRSLVVGQSLGELDPTHWNRVALRLRGSEVWLLLNDVPALYLADASDQPGVMGLSVTREGNPDDEDLVSVVFSGLTWSELEGPPDEEPPPDSVEQAPAPNPILRP
jgi:hypothetical protein